VEEMEEQGEAEVDKDPPPLPARGGVGEEVIQAVMLVVSVGDTVDVGLTEGQAE